MAITVTLLMTACSHLPLSGVRSADAPSTPPETHTAAAQPARLDTSTIADLLIAEIASQRQVPELSANYYTRQAQLTQDIKVLRQATLLNFYLSQPERSYSLGQSWLLQSPDNVEALQITALSAVSTGRETAANPLLERLINAGGDEGLLGLFRHMQSLDNVDQQALITQLVELHQAYPRQPVLLYAKALDRQRQQQYEPALKAVRQANRRLPRHLESRLLEGELLFATGRLHQGHRHYRRLLDRYADNQPVIAHYLQQLFAIDDTDRAARLIEQYRDAEPGFRFALALIATDAKAHERAEELLKVLLDEGYRNNEVLLYLAHLAEQQDQLSTARDYLLRVQGHQRLRSQVQAARIEYLLGDKAAAGLRMRNLRQKHPELAISLQQAEIEILKEINPNAARELISSAIDNDPSNIQLRYQRALIAAQQGELAAMEADLEYILTQNPNDPAALNAWGYTLADMNIRLDEAYDYIKRALAQRPDDPAIQDSMGWVLYRMERHDEALVHLRRAHDAFPDPEITAHLAQVLAALGKTGDAIALLKQQLQTHPDSTLLLDALKMLRRQ